MDKVNLTPKELADRLSVAVGTLANWRVAGTGPRYIKNGPRRVLYPINEVIAWEQGNIVSSTAEYANGR